MKNKTLITIILFIFSTLLPLDLSAQFISNSFSANFKQIYKSTLTGKKKISSGKIDYKYPGKIKIEIISPNKSLFIANKKDSWYYVPPFIEGEKGEVIYRPSKKLMLYNFFDKLKYGLKSNKIYKVKTIFNNLKKEQIVKVLYFNKKFIEKTFISKAQLIFPKKNHPQLLLKNVSAIILEYKNGKKVKLLFENFHENILFSKKYFTFKKA